MKHTQCNDKIELCGHESGQVLHPAALHTAGRLFLSQDRCHPLIGTLHHCAGHVDCEDVESTRGKKLGVSPARATDVEHAGERSIGVPLDERKQPPVRLARRKPFDLFLFVPKL